MALVFSAPFIAGPTGYRDEFVGNSFIYISNISGIGLQYGGPIGSYLYTSNTDKSIRASINFIPKLSSVNKLSLSFWLKVDPNDYIGVDPFQQLISLLVTSNTVDEERFRLEWDGSGYTWFGNAVTNSLGGAGYNASAWKSNDWNHCILTVDIKESETLCNFRVNGVNYLTTFPGGSFTFKDYLIINHSQLIFSICDLKIYNHILSEYEMLELERAPVLHYSFNYSIEWFGNKDYSYTGDVQEVTLPIGTYKLECWGADGGELSSNTAEPGKGGYSSGEITLSSSTVLYIVVGGKGKGGGATPGGYNGGGGTTGTHTNNANHTGGGGASHIATIAGTLRSLSNYQSSILIVAGGGGGQGTSTGSGGNGGGIVGQDGRGNSVNIGKGGTQTAAGVYPGGNDNEPGGFGFGSGGPNNTVGGTGGGGWYGGSFGTRTNGGGGGGSGYIGGVTNGITVQPTETGYVSNPDTSGNGYIRITQIG